jgi:hypothetical protein
MGGTDFAVAGAGMPDEGFGSAQVGLTGVEKRLLDCTLIGIRGISISRMSIDVEGFSCHILI